MIYHKPVLLHEILHILNPINNNIYLDCTLGAGEHAKSILNVSSPNGKIIGIDRDYEAIILAKNNLIDFNNRVHFFWSSFDNIIEILESLKIKYVDGVLLDLGISSMQLDSPTRGFSFKYNSFLDMRMDNISGINASQLLMDLTEKDLARIFKELGEEPQAKKIAYNLVKYRKKNKITKTKQLVEIIEKTVYKNRLYKKIHPATHVFRAIRLLVNDELGQLNRFLKIVPNIINTNGKLIIISYHSLEDRIVKKAFKNLSSTCNCNHKIPICTCNKKSTFKLPRIKVIRPNNKEIEYNIRSRSAKLRIAIKI